VHKLALYLVFQPRIQTSLDRTKESWNHHQIRTERNRSPVALFELSREEAIRLGYWTGDPGDAVDGVNEVYGVDGEGPVPPPEDSEAGNFSSDAEIQLARELMGDFDWDRDDGNWGIEVFCEAVIRLASVWT
jgi:hypothetical protein